MPPPPRQFDVRPVDSRFNDQFWQQFVFNQHDDPNPNRDARFSRVLDQNPSPNVYIRMGDPTGGASCPTSSATTYSGPSRNSCSSSPARIVGVSSLASGTGHVGAGSRCGSSPRKKNRICQTPVAARV